MSVATTLRGRMEQMALPLRVDRPHADTPLLPARILNEFVYCPRLAYLEWVQKEWADSADTVEGRNVHRRVDRPSSVLPEPSDVLKEKELRITATELSSNELGIIAKIDLIEIADGTVKPIDYKRGKRPHVAKQAYDPERVQLCAQGLLLEAHGYRCERGVLYFAASRERVTVEFDDELRELTRESIATARQVVESGVIPPPLDDSPKCPRCSLAPICLPDETRVLSDIAENVRPLAVEQTRALPTYVQANHARVAKQGERLEIRVDDDEPTYVRLAETSQLVVMGNVYVTTPTLMELMRRGIPVCWHSFGGWFLGHTQSAWHGNVELRTAQYRGSFEDQVRLKLARGLVEAKIRNARTLLRRNAMERSAVSDTLQELARYAEQARRVRDMNALLGVEGIAANRYFAAFSEMIKSEDQRATFNLHNRNRRPPKDPINALLSLGYAILTRTLTITLSSVGFDPFCGFYHQPRFGRPALALDMMEPFRPLLVDSAVLMAINNGELGESDFISTPLGTNLNDRGRKKFIAALERRLSQEVTHPLFGYRISYRRLLEVQCRLLGRFLLGEIPSYPNFTTR